MADARTYQIVANPTSGRGRARRTALAISDDLRRRGHSVTVRHTERTGDAGAFARKACESAQGAPACIVACGGDGTIQEIAHVLAVLRKQGRPDLPALGLAPAGRCNDFARALGISRDPAGIAEILAVGTSIPVDLGCVNGRHFCTVATVGIDAEISRFVDEMHMPLTGTPAYLYGALRVLLRYKPRGLRIEGEFGVIDEPVFLASTANTSSYGGAVPIAPGASPCDGVLDLCVIAFTSKRRALRLIPSVLRGTHPARPEVRIERTRRLRIDAPRPLELWADGEHIADTPAHIEVVPQAVRVVVRATDNSRSKGSHPGRGDRS